MRKIAVFGAVFVVVALAVCLVSCSSPSAVISFSVNGEIVRSQVVTETSGLDDSAPPLTDGTFKGWFTDEACTIPFSFHDYILSGEFKDITVYALISHDNAEPGPPEIWDEPCEHDLHAGIAPFANTITQTKPARHTSTPFWTVSGMRRSLYPQRRRPVPRTEPMNIGIARVAGSTSRTRIAPLN